MATGLPGNWAAWPLGYLATELHGHWATWQLGYLATGLHGYWAAWLLGCMATGLPGNWATWQLGCMPTGLHGYMATRPAWQLGYLATGLHGYMATRPAWQLGCLANGLHGYWVVRIRRTWRASGVNFGQWPDVGVWQFHNVKIFMLAIGPVGKQKLSPCYILNIKTLKTLCRHSTNLPFVKLKQMRIGFRTEILSLYVTQTKRCKLTTNWQQCIQPEPFRATTRVNSGKRQKF